MSVEPVLKPMIVEGVEVSVEQQREAFDGMVMLVSFTFMNVIGRMIRAGVKPDVADRAADRLLQKLRKQGFVSYQKGAWRWVQ